MSKADLFFRPADVVTTPNGRTLRYWGKYTTKHQNENRAVYVFFDVDSDECVELGSSDVQRLRRVKTSRK